VQTRLVLACTFSLHDMLAQYNLLLAAHCAPALEGNRPQTKWSGRFFSMLQRSQRHGIGTVSMPRHIGEVVCTRFAAKRPRLQIAKMVRVGWLATADEARLLSDRAKVLPGCDNAVEKNTLLAWETGNLRLS
jgi:hypothetical protein